MNKKALSITLTITSILSFLTALCSLFHSIVFLFDSEFINSASHFVKFLVSISLAITFRYVSRSIFEEHTKAISRTPNNFIDLSKIQSDPIKVENKNAKASAANPDETQ